MNSGTRVSKRGQLASSGGPVARSRLPGTNRKLPSMAPSVPSCWMQLWYANSSPPARPAMNR